jgi:hypothetical protein
LGSLVYSEKLVTQDDIVWFVEDLTMEEEQMIQQKEQEISYSISKELTAVDVEMV